LNRLGSDLRIRHGRRFENFEVARQRLMTVVPVTFALIFLLLLGALGCPRDAEKLIPTDWMKIRSSPKYRP
jgi:heavy metal efflux system protein